MYSENLDLFAPEYVLEEIENHTDEILERGGISREDLSVFLSIIKSRIHIIPSEELEPFIEEAKHISPDPDDVHYFALALKLQCPVWSNEKKSKGQYSVKVFSTDDMTKLLL